MPNSGYPQWVMYICGWRSFVHLWRWSPSNDRRPGALCWKKQLFSSACFELHFALLTYLVIIIIWLIVLIKSFVIFPCLFMFFTFILPCFCFHNLMHLLYTLKHGPTQLNKPLQSYVGCFSLQCLFALWPVLALIINGYAYWVSTRNREHLLHHYPWEHTYTASFLLNISILYALTAWKL